MGKIAHEELTVEDEGRVSSRTAENTNCPWDRTSLIVTDSSLFRRLPAGCNARVFPIISEASLGELQGHLS